MKLYCDSSKTEGCWVREGLLPIRWTYNPPPESHNVGEYLAVEAALEAMRLEANWNLEVYTDSQLVWGQVTQDWKVKVAHLRPHVDKVKGLLEITKSTLHWVPREENLAGIELDRRRYIHESIRQG